MLLYLWLDLNWFIFSLRWLFHCHCHCLRHNAQQKCSLGQGCRSMIERVSGNSFLIFFFKMLRISFDQLFIVSLNHCNRVNLIISLLKKEHFTIIFLFHIFFRGLFVVFVFFNPFKGWIRLWLLWFLLLGCWIRLWLLWFLLPGCLIRLWFLWFLLHGCLIRLWLLWGFIFLTRSCFRLWLLWFIFLPRSWLRFWLLMRWWIFFLLPGCTVTKETNLLVLLLALLGGFKEILIIGRFFGLFIVNNLNGRGFLVVDRLLVYLLEIGLNVGLFFLVVKSLYLIVHSLFVY